ncbi:V-type proton ATPase subunit H [Cinnamomum micranthum f. kanehirae]|uniref:V-type proton ATPase subunit H n=1 Tax=Cinnamomum micranthum f. kanehirae TaxID=337451 RepID=A0A3S3P639_9MAGN|nr:V-type proton ATPase subunit H [Cinnamomum micranthum f. kanehirae]
MSRDQDHCNVGSSFNHRILNCEVFSFEWHFPLFYQVLKRDIPWETYMTTKLITGTCLQLLRRYDNRSESHRASLLDDDGPAYIRVFVSILRDIFKEETVEYVLALIDEMLTANPKRAKLFHDKSLANEDTYEPFLS